MSAYLGPTNAIKYALVDLLTAVTYDSGSGAEPAFAVVTADPNQEFQEEPYCLVWRGRSSSEVVTVGQNDRTVRFSIIIVLSLENGQRTQLQTSDYMDNLTDLAQTALDAGDFTDALSGYETTINTYIMTAESSEPVIGESKGGAILINTIDVAVKFIVEL
jgi:hypothetical protein